MTQTRHGSLFFILVITFLSPHGVAWAQETNTMHARLVDSKTEVPVPFATVRIMKGGQTLWGVISNGDGDFQIPSVYKAEVDSIVITCIGYTTAAIKASALLTNQVNTIRLKSIAVSLNEVVVSAHRKGRVTVNNIVEQAIRNIPQNYPAHSFSYNAYYRDYQREENEYVNLNEGIVGIFDEGFTTDDFLTSKIKLYQYQTNRDFKIDSIAAGTYDNNAGGNKFIPGATVFSFGGNELSILRVHDAIRNNNTMCYSYVNTFSTDFVRNHFFKLVGTVLLDGVSLYHLTFKTIPFVTGARYSATGEIFIEHGNFAIHKLVYSTFLKEPGKSTLLYKIQVEYARQDSLMFLNYISCNNIFKSNTNKGFKVMNVAYDRAMHCFIVKFNHEPQSASALDKRNYDLKFDSKPFRISRIEMSTPDNKEFRVFVDNAAELSFFKDPKALAQAFEANFRNIKDMEGNVVNEIKYKLVDQFRELFLLKVSQSPAAPGGPLMSKEIPIRDNLIDSAQLDTSNKWMNTPLKKN